MGNHSLLSTRQPILDVADLTVSYRHGDSWLDAVRDVSLTIYTGETFGLVGESGSGKTSLVLAIMRYLSANGVVRKGSITLAGQDLLTMSKAEMEQVWGTKLALVPQDPQTSLNPSIRIGEQVAEILRHHQKLSPSEAWKKGIELLDMVRIADPGWVASSYPHQISGGMQQRVLIAMALSTEPQLLVLDEPTTGLDVTTQAVVLDLIRDLIRDKRTSALYVTHNLGVVANICDRVAVLYSGELVEIAATNELFHGALHPYSHGLLDSVPRLGESKNQVQLRVIEGRIPPIDSRPSGCVFAPRCPLAIEVCEERPPLYQPGGGRLTRCHRWEEILAGEVSPHQPASQAVGVNVNGDRESPILNLEGIRVHFPVRRTLGEILTGKAQRTVKAVNGVDLEIRRGKTLGLVGESGSGKTTLSRAIMGLVENISGSMQLLTLFLPPDLSDRNLDTLRHMQMVFQNPDEALNPYLTVGETLRRPLRTLLGKTHLEADEEVLKLLTAVGLPSSYAERLPGQLSGGEKQRVAIGRAFASNPDLLIFDEPVSSLDVSVQASILNLINELQAETENSLLLISHDLVVVGYLADRIAVIYLGHLMEVSSAEDLYHPPYHPYTEALLSAIPLADPDARQERIRLEGEIPSPADVPSGCPFHTRCPRFLGDVCINETPPWQSDESGNRIFCHIPLDQLAALQTQVFTFHPDETGSPLTAHLAPE